MSNIHQIILKLDKTTCEGAAIDNASRNSELVVDEHDDGQLETDEVLEDVVAFESDSDLHINDCLV